MIQPFQKRFLSLLALSIALVSCSKEPALDPADQQDLRLIKKLTTLYSPVLTKTVLAAGQTVTYRDIPFYSLSRTQSSYQYDEQKRLVRQEVTPPGSSDPIEYFGATYEYTDNEMVYTKLHTSPLLHYTYQLNTQRYTTDFNTYDPDGYLTRRQQIPGAVTTQTIVAGNIVRKVYQDNSRRSTITYEYDLTKRGLPNPESMLWGRSSRNLLVKTTEITESFTGPGNNLFPDNIVTTYTYEFDQQGLIKQQTAYSESSFLPDPTIVSRELLISSFEFK